MNWTVKQVNGTDKFRILCVRPRACFRQAVKAGLADLAIHRSANTEEAKCVASVRDRVAYNDCANEGDHNLVRAFQPPMVTFSG